MKKLLNLFIFAVALTVLSGCAIIDQDDPDAGPVSEPNPTDLVVDPACSVLKFTDPAADCNDVCQYWIIAEGRSCKKGDPSEPKEREDQATDEVVNSVNFSGIDFGPPQMAIPRITRLLLSAVMGVIAVVTVLMAVYGMIVRTTAADNADKVELSVKIFKNALIGVVISVFGIIIIQLLAMLLGLAENLFDFDLVPPERLMGTVTNQACSPIGKKAYRALTNGEIENYICNRETPTSISGVWQLIP